MALNAPAVAVSVNAPVVAALTRLPNLSFSVMVTVAVVLIAMVVALTANVDVIGSGSVAITTMLRRITIRPAESASVVSGVAFPRSPVRVYGPAIFGGNHDTVATPFASTCTESGVGADDARNRTHDPTAAAALESSTAVLTILSVAPAFTVSSTANVRLAGSTTTGTCGASGLLTGSATPLKVGVIVACVASGVVAFGPAQIPLVSVVPLTATVTVASAISAPRASRANGLIGMESSAVMSARSGST